MDAKLPHNQPINGVDSFEFGSVDLDDLSVTVTPDIGKVLKGDVNQSGTVYFADIPPFISVLQVGSFQPEADCDCNEVVNFSDIPVFISILQGN